MFEFFKFFRALGVVLALTWLSGLGFVPKAMAEETDKAPAATHDDGFVPVDPAEIETVSGKNLMIGAYAVIFTVLAGYTIALWRREKRLENDISHLARRTGVNNAHK